MIPVYNRTVFLGPTIDSVLRQTLPHWELIVVDDGSEENVAGFVSAYVDHRISMLRQANQGNAVARNAGIHLAQGQYVICLDSDDIWEPTMLETSVAYLTQHNDVDVAYTQMQAIDAQGKLMSYPIGPLPHHGDLMPELLMGYPILPSSALARRSCFARWGAYTPGLDDWELWLRWAGSGCRFACIEQPLLHYRIHENNLNLNWSRRLAVHFKTLDTFYQRGALPGVALLLRDRTYANQHAYFAVLAWQLGRADDGISQFVQAVLRYPAYLHDLHLYTQIACAHQGRLAAGTTEGLDLQTAARTLEACLRALFAQAKLPAEISSNRPSAYAWAYLALARLAYGVPHDMGVARQSLLRSLASWPAILWHTDWAMWMARALLGFYTVQALKRPRSPDAAHA